MTRKVSGFIFALASIIGTIIGAGIFAIPYVMAQSGVFTSLFYFAVLGIVVLFLTLFFGEIVLRTKERHRLIGYAGKYLGKKAKTIEALTMITGTIGALVVYIILGGDFLKIIFPLHLSSLQWSLIFWGVLSLFVFLGIRSIAPVELLINVAFFIICGIIFFFGLPKFHFSYLKLIDIHHLFLPYGVVLFSLVGWNAVPEIEKLLLVKRDLKKVIIWALLISISFYFLFGLIISGITGTSTTKEAFRGLVPVLGQKIMVLGGLFGLFCVSTSFLILANYLKNALIFDYHFYRILGFVIATFTPLFLFIIGFREFLPIVSFIGAFMGVVEGTIISLTFKEAKLRGDRKPEYNLSVPRFLIYIIPIVFYIGALVQIIYYIKG